jgi:hypothetical protein
LKSSPLKKRYDAFCDDAQELLHRSGLLCNRAPAIAGRAFYEACVALARIHFPEDKEVNGIGPRGLLWGMFGAVNPSHVGGKNPEPVSGAKSVALVLQRIMKNRPPLHIEAPADSQTADSTRFDKARKRHRSGRERGDAERQLPKSGKPIDVFISYSTEDREIAKDLANRLRVLQLSVFMAHDTITTGPTWRSQVGVALRRCTVAVLLLSTRSLQSDWVRYEIGAIWALNKPVAPALVDCEIAQLPDLVREYQARSVPTAADRSIFCYEVERLVRAARTNDTPSD